VGEACDDVTALLTENGMHGGSDPVLLDWAYVPHQTLPADAWPRGIELPYGWLDRLEEEREVARLPLLDFAMSLGCIWIKFDGAASVIDGLPTFEW
jgi:hypothetical protein